MHLGSLRQSFPAAECGKRFVRRRTTKEDYNWESIDELLVRLPVIWLFLVRCYVLDPDSRQQGDLLRFPRQKLRLHQTRWDCRLEGSVLDSWGSFSRYYILICPAMKVF